MAHEEILSPVTGTLFKCKFADGELVEDGEEIALIESMKMTMPVYARSNGKISYNFNEGAMVPADEVIAEIQIDD